MTTPAPQFIHAADLHLGAPLQSLGSRLRHDPEKLGELRRLASKSLGNMVEVVLERQAGFVVLSGDVYDHADREVSSQLAFDRALRRLGSEGGSGPIPVFVVHGNHDPLVSGFKPAAALPDHVHVFGPGDPTSVVTEVAGVGQVNVAGVSFASQSESENLVRRFAALSIDRSLPTVGVVHANLEGTTGHDPYAPCSKGDLEASPVGYWALGHVHNRVVSSMGPGRWWAYPGNLQGRSTKATECGPKGVLSVGIGRDGFAEPEFVACDSVRFQRVQLDISDASDLSAMVQLVSEHSTDLTAGADGRPLLIAVELVGRTSLHQELSGLSTHGELLAQCREELGGGLGLGELLRVRNSTLPEADIAQLMKSTGLLPEVLRFLESVETNGGDEPATELRAQLMEALPKSLLRAIDPDQQFSDLIDGARRILIDELLGSVVER